MLVESGKVNGYISALTPAIVYFDRRRVFTEQESRSAVERLLSNFKVIALTRNLIKHALGHPCPEFEDNIQLVSAIKAKVDYIVTRNKKHYRQMDIDVFTPDEFIQIYRES
jgi:predicted nucleic acid-binding protein